MLGNTGCMLIWDKLRRGMFQADCELAWTNFDDKPRVFTFRWNGFQQGDMLHKEERIHPTQKPVKLYEWIFKRYAKDGDKIFDPFLGSGSSRIAAYDVGLDFVGCELDKVYFDLEEKRFEEHTAQMNLFIDGGNT